MKSPPANRRHPEFARVTIRKAIREAEEERARLAHLAQPDSETEADDWANAEEWKP